MHLFCAKMQGTSFTPRPSLPSLWLLAVCKYGWEGLWGSSHAWHQVDREGGGTNHNISHQPVPDVLKNEQYWSCLKERRSLFTHNPPPPHTHTHTHTQFDYYILTYYSFCPTISVVGGLLLPQTTAFSFYKINSHSSFQCKTWALYCKTWTMHGSTGPHRQQ